MKKVLFHGECLDSNQEGRELEGMEGGGKKKRKLYLSGDSRYDLQATPETEGACMDLSKNKLHLRKKKMGEIAEDQDV